MGSDENRGCKFEEENVHRVYKNISSHFNETRKSRVWPGAKRFIMELPTGSLGIDVGCGNGRYLNLRSDILIIGLDACVELLSYGKEFDSHLIEGNALALPYKTEIFDFAFNVAMLHHLSTESRRKLAIKEMARCLKPGGLLYIQVWSSEGQNPELKLDSQDAMIPWRSNNHIDDNVHYRYYHLFLRGELEELCKNADKLVTVEVGYEAGNWYGIFKKPLFS